MNSETKVCQNCKNAFVIEAQDFEFYQKIEVPPPTFCPDCRLQRRLTWRNERTLYKGKCAATGKDFLTMFSPESKIVVYNRDYWWSDNWDQLASSRDYDFSRPFFEQFQELLHAAPLPNLANTNVVQSDYGNHNADCKNCYLVYASFTNENLSYSSGCMNGRDSMDLYTADHAESCYEDSFCAKINKVSFSYDSEDSLNSAFLRSCKNMNDCLACINMRNKSFHIWNQAYSKEEYKKKIGEYDFGSYKILSDFKKEYESFIKRYPRRFASILRSVNTTGDIMTNAKNAKYCFDGYGGIEDSKYAVHAVNLKDSYDGYGFGANAELLYEGVDSGINGSNYKFTVYTHTCRDVSYTYCCHSSSHLFGCVGLRSKEYCILNKQYSKEEYEKLVPRIIQHMKEMPYCDSQGRRYEYGEFFPVEVSPFAYNETIAQEYFPLNQAKIATAGFLWRDPMEKKHEVTVMAGNLPDHVKDIGDDILNQVIGCEHGGTCTHQCMAAFKVIPNELEFYRKANIALPRLCSNCRHYERLAMRNPFRLWKGKCQCEGKNSNNKAYQNTGSHFHDLNPCPNTFETSYAPDRPEIVYCEQCYQAEVV
ncbi:MAG: hypothetical protein AAB691_00725 [Patescibacteria group bacterium]